MTTATVFDHPDAATHGHLLWQCVPETLHLAPPSLRRFLVAASQFL